jgi:hypothetical protein
MNVDIFSRDKRISEICSTYWAVDEHGQFNVTVAEITNLFGINSASLLKLVKGNCAAYSDEVFCKICQEPYQFINRSNYNNFSSPASWICSDCQAQQHSNKEEEHRNTLLNILKSRATDALFVDDLSFRQAVYLLALIRFAANEDLSFISPYETNKTQYLSPDYEFDLSILKYLYHSGITAINPLSDLDAFEFKEEGRFSFYLDRVTWSFVLPEGIPHPRYLIEALESKMSSDDYMNQKHDEVSELVKEISLLECINYLEFVVAKHQLSFTPGEKTKLILGQVLEKFSVAQAYSFIWRSAKDAAAFYMRAQVNRKHAANTVVSNIQRQYEQAIANNWDVSAFRRNYDRPQSVISQVVFNTCLKTDDGGFSLPMYKLLHSIRDAQLLNLNQ